MSRRAAGLLLGAAVSLVGCGQGVIEAAGGDPAAELAADLTNGQLDSSRTWSVGLCQGPLNTDPALGPVGTCLDGAKCTGTLVGRNLVLTARHCVSEATWGPAALSGADPCDGSFTGAALVPGGTWATTSSSVLLGNPTWFEVSQVLVPPGSNYCRDDLALLVLKTPVPASQARPVGINARRDLARRPPTAVAVVGRGANDDTFGLDANGDWDGSWTIDKTDSLVRKVQENIPFVCATNAQTGCAVVSHEVPTSHRFPTPLNWYVVGRGLASGDSGSAIFDQRRFKSGRPRVIGVNVWGFIAPSGKSEQGAGVRLDGFRDFLRNGVRQAAQAIGEQGCDVDTDDGD